MEQNIIILEKEKIETLKPKKYRLKNKEEIIHKIIYYRMLLSKIENNYKNLNTLNYYEKINKFVNLDNSNLPNNQIKFESLTNTKEYNKKIFRIRIVNLDEYMIEIIDSMEDSNLNKEKLKQAYLNYKISKKLLIRKKNSTLEVQEKKKELVDILSKIKINNNYIILKKTIRTLENSLLKLKYSKNRELTLGLNNKIIDDK